ncbi:MAG: hypothetical protein ACE5JL_07145 [Dehalococcoidia bacterium]
MDEYRTRGERREEKQRKRRKMRIVGRSVKNLLVILQRRAENLRKKRAE